MEPNQCTPAGPESQRPESQGTSDSRTRNSPKSTQSDDQENKARTSDATRIIIIIYENQTMQASPTSTATEGEARKKSKTPTAVSSKAPLTFTPNERR